VVSAKSATATIPIVFTLGTDPVRLSLVASLNRPGGNVTGVYLYTGSIDAKRLGILHDLLPGASLIAVLLNPKNPNVAERLKIIEDAARIIGRPLHVVPASTVQDLDTAFAALAQVRAQALFVGADPFFNAQRIGIVSRVADLAIPAIYEGREFAVAGGLMSYGTSFFDNYRQVGLYAGRILKGEKAAELPVVQSTKFELVLNLKTAKALGLQVPPGLSAQADEIIE
jgi:putative ABC transport system substrate-binding protein